MRCGWPVEAVWIAVDRLWVGCAAAVDGLWNHCAEPGDSRQLPQRPCTPPTIDSMHMTHRPLLAAGLMLSLTAPCWSQGQAARSAEPSVQPGPGNQTIERIRTEDEGTRIDELRVGGQTQSISVQPKNDMPAYEIRPADPQGGPNAGKRMWNFIKF